MARGRNNKLRKGERAAAKMGMPVNPVDKLPTPAASTRSRLTASIEEKKHQQQASAAAHPAGTGLTAAVAGASGSSAASAAAWAAVRQKYADARAKTPAGGNRLNSYLAGFAGASGDAWHKDGDGEYYYDDEGYYYAEDEDYYDEEEEDGEEEEEDDDDDNDNDEDNYCTEDELDSGTDDGWADEEDDVHPGPPSAPHGYGWGRRDQSTNTASSAAKTKSTAVYPPSTAVNKAKSSSSAARKGSPPDPLDDEDLCDHSGLIVSRMRTVTSLLNEIFCASFKMALPSLYRGMVYNLQDEIMRDKILEFMEGGYSPKEIRSLATDSFTRHGMKSQLKLACADELADVVLRLSTEDAFDLLCDLAMRHGRNLRRWGPPCACSFSHCLPCLERLVSTVRTTPPPKDYSLYSNPAMDSTSRLAIAAATAKANEVDKSKNITAGKGKGKKGAKSNAVVKGGAAANGKPGAANIKSSAAAGTPRLRSKLARADLLDWVAGFVEADWVEKRQDWSDPAAWEADIWAAWQSMNDVLWDIAEEIDPLALARVSEYLAGLGKMNGLDLYYAVVTRELTFNPTTPRKKPSLASTQRDQEDGIVANKNPPTKVVADAISWEGIYERMKKETRELRRKQRAEERGKGKLDGSSKPKTITSIPAAAALPADEDDEDDVEGSDYRRALARAVREQGNSAYASGSYMDAVDHYTRAIGYDTAEPIYPLNRAACLLKLRMFEDAERDCTAAIRLDPNNHKAYFRRGASRAGMGKISLAREDFDKVLELHVDSPDACDELRKLADKLLAEAPAGNGSAGAGKKAVAGKKDSGASRAAAASKSEPARTPAQIVEEMLDQQTAWLKTELKRHAREDAKERAKKRRARIEAEEQRQRAAQTQAQLQPQLPPGTLLDLNDMSMAELETQYKLDRMTAAKMVLASGFGADNPVLRREVELIAAGSESEPSRHHDEAADDSDVVAPSSATSEMAQGSSGSAADAATAASASSPEKRVRGLPSFQGITPSMVEALHRENQAQRAEVADLQRRLAEMRLAMGAAVSTASQVQQGAAGQTPAPAQGKAALSASAAQSGATSLPAAQQLDKIAETLANSDNAALAEDEGVRALMTNPSETVACWTTFAFVFSLIVAQKTGINVPERLGFVRQYNQSGAASTDGRSGPSVAGAKPAAATTGSMEGKQQLGEQEDTLLAELRRAAEAKKSSLRADASAAVANRKGPGSDVGMSDTLELLRSVPLEDHLDRIVNFLRQPEVQPVILAS